MGAPSRVNTCTTWLTYSGASTPCLHTTRQNISSTERVGCPRPITRGEIQRRWKCGDDTPRTSCVRPVWLWCVPAAPQPQPCTPIRVGAVVREGGDDRCPRQGPPSNVDTASNIESCGPSGNAWSTRVRVSAGDVVDRSSPATRGTSVMTTTTAPSTEASSACHATPRQADATVQR